MAQAVRERTNELAVLKTLGFTDGRVLALVLTESFVLPFVAGTAGLTVWLLVARANPTGGTVPMSPLSPSEMALGALIALLVLWLGFTVVGAWWGAELGTMLEGDSIRFLPARFVAALVGGGMAVGAAGGFAAARHAV
jgi:putative ABC transport system permease protein